METKTFSTVLTELFSTNTWELVITRTMSIAARETAMEEGVMSITSTRTVIMDTNHSTTGITMKNVDVHLDDHSYHVHQEKYRSSGYKPPKISTYHEPQKPRFKLPPGFGKPKFEEPEIPSGNSFFGRQPTSSPETDFRLSRRPTFPRSLNLPVLEGQNAKARVSSELPPLSADGSGCDLNNREASNSELFHQNQQGLQT